MQLLNDQIRNDVRVMLADVKNPVKLTVFTRSDDCEYCAETRELMEEVAALSDQLTLEVFDFEGDPEMVRAFGVDKAPAVAITGAKDYGIRLYGIPSGYEFGGLLEAVKLVSDGRSELAEGSKELLAGLEEPVHVQVFTTPSCPYCPRAVLLAFQMAIESDLVTADMVEVMEFPDLATRYQVMGVPRTVMNETVQIEGAVPEPMLMEEFAKLSLKTPQRG